MKLYVTSALLLLTVISITLPSPLLAYRSQYHNPPLSPDCDRPNHQLEVIYKWKQLGFYDFPSTTPDFTFDEPNGTFIQYNNIPIGIAPYKDNKLFVTVPRRGRGIPSTLNYIDMTSRTANQSPLLRSFPDLETNRFDPLSPANPDRLISVYRPRVDIGCNRLWLVDTGILEYGDRVQVQQPSIWVLDLETGKRIRRFEIPTSSVTRGNGLVSITVDSEPDRCDRAYAYIPDMFNYRLHVYSFAQDRMWTFSHNFFYLDPLYGDLNIAGQKFQWRDGVFSLTLGPYQEDGNREAYFHSFASLNEFVVSTRVLKNATNAARSYHGERDFKFLGKRQELGQSNMHAFDETTGVVFYSEPNRNAIGCWNTGERFEADKHDIVTKDDRQLVYPSDLTVDDDGYVWVLSNRIPQFVYARLDTEEYNFIVWKGKASEIIQKTKCE